MSLFPVSEEKRKWLQEKMEALSISEKDLEEKFIRSSGKGGQKVNKSSSCVYLKHLPTGIEVKWMTERSQGLNRYLARRELVRKMERRSGKCEDDRVKRIRRQKSKKRKRASLKSWSLPRSKIARV